MSEAMRDASDEPRQPRRHSVREVAGALPAKQVGLSVGREEDCSKQNSFLSTKRMSEHSQREEPFEGFVPIIKRVSEEELAPECALHQHKRLKYFDISAPQLRLCSKCVLELVVDRNFNSSMTKEGSPL